jgi:hypothetical protein
MWQKLRVYAIKTGRRLAMRFREHVHNLKEGLLEK